MTGERKTHFLGCDVTKQHHTLTQILMGLLNNGFELEVVEEAPPLIVLPAFADRQSKGCREALPYHPGIAADKPEFEFLQIITF